MRLLIMAQAVDEADTTLGFFVRWIEKLSARFESIHVIALRAGKFALPAHVSVTTLRRAQEDSRFTLGIRSFTLAWKLRREYDTVFVHMNQEYVLINGLLWKLLGKKIYLWRNHKMGDWQTTLAVSLADKVLYTSKDSFTAHFAKALMMPAGVDVELFEKPLEVERKPHSLLVFGRIAPVKHIEMAIEVLAELKKRGVDATLDIVGDALPRDAGYETSIRHQVSASDLNERVAFSPGVAFTDAPKVYHSREVFLNFTLSGSFDKTVIEALASGCKVIALNDSMKDDLPAGSWMDGTVRDAAEKITAFFAFDAEKNNAYGAEAREIARRHSLGMLVERLMSSML